MLQCATRFGSAAKVLAKRMLMYYRASERSGRSVQAYLAVVVVPDIRMRSIDPVQRVLGPGGREVPRGLGSHKPLVVGEQVVQQEFGPAACLEARLQAWHTSLDQFAIMMGLLEAPLFMLTGSCISMPSRVDNRHQPR